VPRSKKSPGSQTTGPRKLAPVLEESAFGIGSLTPWGVFQAALKAVPALRYALGVLGMVSAIAIIKGFGVDFRAAVFGTIIMLVLMVGLVVFAALTKVPGLHLRSAAVVLMWSLLAITILTAVLLFTSFFFAFPKGLLDLLRITEAEPNRSSIEVRFENVTVEIGRELQTEIGTIRPDPRQESVAARPDGIHERFYTDRQRGFVLSLNQPEDWSDWSIVQAKASVDEAGQPSKEFRFSPGLLGAQEIRIRTDDGVVGFVTARKYRYGAASLFIYQLAGRTGSVEDVIEEEEQKGIRIAIVWAVYQMAFAMSHPAMGVEKSPGPREDLKLSRIVVSPDRQSALLEWRRPHGMYGDIVGRVVVGPKSTYLLVALRIDPITPEDTKINQDLRSMLESFQLL
jgi:hypothetical protein